MITQENDNKKVHLLVYFSTRKNVRVDHGVNLTLQSRLMEESRNAEQASTHPLFMGTEEEQWHLQEGLEFAFYAYQ